MSTERWLTTLEAANHLGYKPISMRMSRVSGKLGGKDAPLHAKRGRAVRYKLSDLDKWMNGE